MWMFFCSTRDPFVYQQKQRIVAEGEINGEIIKVLQTDDTCVKIKRKKSLQLR
jgi:hypothetical protein